MLLIASLFLHTPTQLETWVDDWIDDALDVGVTIEAFDDFMDMARRHPQFFGRPVPPRDATSNKRVAASPSTTGTAPAGVEQWRSLVAAYFPNEVETALRIIACESRGNPNAKNKGSSAAGLWQFLRSTWDRAAASTGSPTYSQGGPYDPVWATINAAWLRARGSGWNQWECY